MPRSADFVRHRLGRAAALAAAVSLLTVGLASAAPGNNGTVKIHDGISDEAPVINNEPHVGCTFHLHFFFADAAQTGDWRIDQQAPTGKAPSGLSGSYETDANGEDTTDPLTLSTGHYKLYWEGRSDKNVKHKTFWVACDGGGGGGIGGGG